MPGGRPRAKTQADSVKSVVKVLDILEHLGSSQGAVSVSDLARATGLERQHGLPPAADADGARLRRAGDRRTAATCSGPRIFQMGSAYLQGSDLAAIARPHLEALRDEVGETAYLVMFSQGEIVQLCKADGKQAVSAAIRSMVREPAYCTATGKVLLSGARRRTSSTSIVQSVQLQTFTPQTLTSKAAAAAGDREGARERLCARRRGVRAEPVLRQRSGARSQRRRTVAAISIAMPKMRFKRTLRCRAGAKLRCARRSVADLASSSA